MKGLVPRVVEDNRLNPKDIRSDKSYFDAIEMIRFCPKIKKSLEEEEEIEFFS